MARQCPHCKVTLIGHQNTEGREAPEHGDFTLCGSCGGWCVFELYQSGGKIKVAVVKPTKQQHAEIMSDHRCTVLFAQWSEWNRTQRARN